LVLRACDREKVAWLEGHVGELMCARDDRGRKVYGLYSKVETGEYRTEPELGDIALDFVEVSHDEGLDPL
jgi:hypothetical protein